MRFKTQNQEPWNPEPMACQVHQAHAVSQYHRMYCREITDRVHITVERERIQEGRERERKGEREGATKMPDGGIP